MPAINRGPFVQATGNPQESGPVKVPVRPTCRPGRLCSTLVYLGFLCALFLLAESIFRFVHTPGDGLVRFLFHTEMAVSRRAYLDRYPELFDTAALTRPLRSNSVYVQQPEQDRPPFDRVDHPYRIRANEKGFRTRSLGEPKRPGTRRIAFLGDSNTWGKGLGEEMRFSDILEHRMPADVQVFNLGLEGCASDCLAEVLHSSAALQPDLVVLQVSGNDLDQTIWRESRATPPSVLWAEVLAVLSRSRFLMAATYALVGDPHEEKRAAMLARAREFYAPAVQRIFRTCRERGIGIVLLGLAYADGTRYGDHYFEGCRRNPDVCRGIVVEDFAHDDAWLASAPSAVLHEPRGKDWVDRTAEDMGVAVKDMEKVFPYRDLFYDIVHLNQRGNWIVARQLLPLMRAWEADTRPQGASVEPGTGDAGVRRSP